MTRPIAVIVCFTNISRDPRVLRHVSALNADFEVITVGYGSLPPGASAHHEIPASAGYLPLNAGSLAGIGLHRYSMAYWNTPAVKSAREILAGLQADLIIANDVLTTGVSVDYANGASVLIDMHEYAPLELADDWRFRVLLQRYYTWLCRTYLPRASLVTSVSPGLVARYAEEFGVRCELILNAREYQDLAPSPVENDRIRLVHSGVANQQRGLEAMIDAVKGLPTHSLDLYLVEVPRQEAFLAMLHSRVADAPNVNIIPPVPMAELPTVLNSYDVGLSFIAPDNFSLQHSLGNKLFDFVQARLGVVAGPLPSVDALFREWGFGLSTEGFAPAQLRETLASLTPDSVRTLKSRSDVAARKISAEAEKVKLLALANELMLTRRTSG